MLGPEKLDVRKMRSEPLKSRSGHESEILAVVSAVALYAVFHGKKIQGDFIQG